MPLFAPRRKRQSLPPQPAALDPSWVARGLVAAYLPSGVALPSKAVPFPGVSASSGVIGAGTFSDGPGVSTSENTFIVLATLQAYTDSVLIGRSRYTGSVNAGVMLRLNNTGFEAIKADGGGTWAWAAAGGQVRLGRRAYAAIVTAADYARLFVDGAEVPRSASGGATTAISRVDSAIDIGKNTVSGSGISAQINGGVEIALQFDRALTGAEIAQLSANPYQVFASTSRAISTPVQTIFSIVGAGGAVLGGAAAASAQPSYLAEGSGGAALSGTAAVSRTANYVAAGAGSVVLGGTASSSYQAGYAAAGSGGAVLGGAAVVSGSAGYAVPGSGGAVSGGSAVCSFTRPYSATGAGGAALGGAAYSEAAAKFIASVTGGAMLAGNAPAEYFPAFDLTSDGGVVMITGAALAEFEVADQVPKRVRLQLRTAARSPAANLSGLSAAFFDTPLLHQIGAPSVTAQGLSTDADGYLALDVTASTLPVGGIGYMVEGNATGDPTAAHSGWHGPVKVEAA